MKPIIVTEQPQHWAFLSSHAEIVRATDYLIDETLANQHGIRIINLCQSYRYQSLGYYVSLLAEARSHKVIPNVLTIQDFSAKTSLALITIDLDEEIQHALHAIKSDTFTLSIYFGKNLAQHYNTLARKLHALLPTPLFRVELIRKNDKWKVHKIYPLAYTDIPEHHLEFTEQAAKEYLEKKRFNPARRKNITHDIAILHNPNELNPPSDKNALKLFIKAGEKFGMNVELIEKDDFKLLNQYEALFIRETTSVNHYTYRFSRRAAAERLPVLDDPVSILLCTNKVYLAELLRKHRIKIPQSTILSKLNWQEKAGEMTFPCVLKQPDSAFSLGVIKVNNLEEFHTACRQFLQNSELIIAQPFIPTEFDWRIGVLDNKPLFACRYYMAHNHWQIYNWEGKKTTEGEYGEHDCIAIENVPPHVISTALRASKLIGDGLYGVDLKQIKNEVYVIEVNDNPSIDHKFEDELLGDALYESIMQVFLQRIKRQHGYE